MSSLRSRRAWIPAAVAAVGMVAVLFGVGAADRAGTGADGGPGADAPLWRFLLRADNLFFGRDPFSGADRVLTSTLAAAAAVLVIGFGATWWALRGLRPGSSAVPAFLSAWASLTVGCVVGSLVRWVALAGSLDGAGAGQAQYAALRDGAVAGMRLGWIAALVATLVWLAVRPRADDDLEPLPLVEDDEEERPREYVMKRRSDFNLEDRASAERNAETFGRRAGDRPELDDDARTTELPATVPAYADRRAPVADEQPTAPAYVGRRSSGRYADDEEPDTASPEGGSHRG